MKERKLKLAEDTRTPKDYLQGSLINLVNAIMYNGYPKGKDYVIYSDADVIQKIKNIYQSVNTADRWDIIKKMFSQNKQLLAHHKISMAASGVCYIGDRPILVEPDLSLKDFLESRQ